MKVVVVVGETGGEDGEDNSTRKDIRMKKSDSASVLPTDSVLRSRRPMAFAICTFFCNCIDKSMRSIIV